MENLEDLKRRIQTASDLHSLVRTMKAMAAVNIRQLEHAVDSLSDYKRTVEMGLQIVMRTRDRVQINARHAPHRAIGAIVFGSDQGMCGQLNDLVASFAFDKLNVNANEARHNDTRVIAVGARVAARIEDAGQPVEKTVSVANSTAGVTPLVQDLLLLIDDWNQQDAVGKVVVIYSEHTSRASYEVRSLNLLPIDRRWLKSFREKAWPTNQTPSFTMDPNQLFSTLIRQYLFVSLYRACAESLASENASRLAAMQGAERNIGNRIEGLTKQFHQTRQMSITEELLDIASGFEAIENPGS